MRKDQGASALYDALCEEWAAVHSYLRPGGGPSYTDSYEAFPYRGEFSIDLEALRQRIELKEFDQALLKLRAAKLVQ